MRTTSSGVLALATFLAAASAFAQSTPKPDTPARPAASPLRAVSTDGAPKASGPYSQAIVEGGFLFAAGQISRDPKTGAVLPGPSEQAKRMGEGRPARTTIFVAGLPGGAPIEMDLIARARK